MNTDRTMHIQCMSFHDNVLNLILFEFMFLLCCIYAAYAAQSAYSAPAVNNSYRNNLFSISYHYIDAYFFQKETFLEDLNDITPRVDEIFRRLTKTAVVCITILFK